MSNQQVINNLLTEGIKISNKINKDQYKRIVMFGYYKPRKTWRIMVLIHVQGVVIPENIVDHLNANELPDMAFEAIETYGCKLEVMVDDVPKFY